jgi:tetratricopeptide (TPR) repeat protein
MYALIPIALFGWIPMILVLFSALPPRRAVLASFILAWLFLPYAGYDLPGLPDYTKRSATSLGVLLGTALFRMDWLLAVRPRWFDLPIATWCLCPIASSLTNELGIYDGLASSFDYFVSWGLPYLIGRVYFDRLEHIREMAVAIVMGGLIYIPLCAWEMKMSPNIHKIIYVIDPGGWQEVSYGGYRPKVFMSCGLELAMWMGSTATAGVWLWASGALKQIRGWPFGVPMAALVLTAILCRVTGPWVLMFLGISLWFSLKWTRSRLPILVLFLVPSAYILIRASHLWSGQEAVHMVEAVLNQRRAESLAFRMKNEDMLVGKAIERPIFGWGGWSRARVFDEDTGKDLTITDGMWVIALGNNGLVGLCSFYASLLLPMVLLYRRFPPHAWLSPVLAPACALAVLDNMYAIDCIANAMPNPIFFLAAGAVTGVIGAIDPRRVSLAAPGHADPLEGPRGHADALHAPSGAGRPVHPDPREAAAIRLGSQGRSMREQGRPLEAEEAWLAALQIWAELAADYPDDLEYRKCWLDGLNDAAWTLITAHGVQPREVARAIRFAEQTVGLEPDGATYWNTLGIAYCRAGDWNAAIHALNRSVELDGEGTSFDFFFLAIAHWRRGDQEQARGWYSRGSDWMAENHPEHASLLRFRAEAASLLDAHPLPV